MPKTWCPRPESNSPESIELLEACAEVLDSRGLLYASSLQAACLNAEACWSGVAVPCEPLSPRLPWVGANYSDSRVLVIAMNPQSHRGLWDEAFCVEQALAQLALGRQRFFGVKGESTSWFHYRAAVIASLLVADRLGDELSIPDPQSAGEALRRSARIQSVQCSPAGNNRRSPSREMLRRCPDFVLWPMVERLAPSTIAVLGTDARNSLERRHEVVLDRVDPLVRVGLVEREGGESVRVVALRHPSSGHGMQSITALLRLLRLDRLWPVGRAD